MFLLFQELNISCDSHFCMKSGMFPFVLKRSNSVSENGSCAKQLHDVCSVYSHLVLMGMPFDYIIMHFISFTCLQVMATQRMILSPIIRSLAHLYLFGTVRSKATFKPFFKVCFVTGFMSNLVNGNV